MKMVRLMMTKKCTAVRDLGGLNGLPVAGFAVETFKNGFIGEGGNTIGNYGGIYKHKATRKQGSDAGFGPGDLIPMHGWTITVCSIVDL